MLLLILTLLSFPHYTVPLDWTATETYEALKLYMDMDFDGLKADIVQMLGGERVRVNRKSRYCFC